METTTDQRPVSDSRFRSLTTTGKVRLLVFSLAMLALAALNVALTPLEVLGAGILGWFQSYGVHQFHDMVISVLLVFGVVIPALLLLYHPRDRVNAILAPALGMIIVAILGLNIDSPIATGFLVSAVLGLVGLALHPAGRSLFRFERAESVDTRVAALYVVAAVPLLAYAGLELLKQLGPLDPDGHALFVHFGAIAIASFLVVLMGGLAVFRERDWRFATWLAGLLAGFIGIASMGFPNEPSSLGLLGGAALFLWALAFVASVEYTRRDTGQGDEQPDSQRMAGAA